MSEKGNRFLTWLSGIVLIAIGAGLLTTVISTWAIALCVSLYVRDSYQHGARKLTEAEGGGFLVVNRVERTGSLFVEADLWSARNLAGDEVVAESQCDPQVLARDLGVARTIPWLLASGPWPEYGSRYIEARGWPFRCLWCEVRYEYDPANPLCSKPQLSRFRGGVAVNQVRMLRGIDGVPRCAALPYLPLWKGLLLNTGIFATAWSALLSGLGSIRRRGRVQRGLCPKCAYDLKGQLNQGCPECGWGR